MKDDIHRHEILERRLAEASRPSLGDGLRRLARDMEDEASAWSRTRRVTVDLRAVSRMTREQKKAYYMRNAEDAGYP